MQAYQQLAILVIEDNPLDREAYRRYLCKDNDCRYHIQEAETAAEGLELYQKHQPDVVLLDYFLPDVEGIEFIECLQKIAGKVGPHILLITGQEDEETALEAIKLGVRDYLVKDHLSPESLRIAVKKVVQQVQTQKRRRLILDLALKIRSYLGSEELFTLAVSEIRKIFKCDRVLIYKFAEDRSGKIIAESVGPGWTIASGQQIKDTCFQAGAGEAYLQGRTKAIANVQEAGLSPCHLQLLEKFEVKANLVVPILLKSEGTNQLWGLLIAHQCSGPRVWEQEELELLEDIEVQLAITLQQAELIRNLRKENYQRRQAQRELKKLNRELETKVADRTTQLKQATKVLNYHVENTPLAVIEWDADFRVKRWFPQAEAIFGWQAEEAVGKFPEELNLVYWEDQQLVDRAMAELQKGKKVRLRVENRNHHKFGHVLHCVWYTSVLFDGAGNLVSVLSMTEDITEQQQAETALYESEERLGLFVSHVPNAIAMFDAQMRYLKVSNKWLQDYGLEREEIIGRSHYEVFPEIPQRWQDIHQKCLGGEVRKCEQDSFLRADGSLDWIRWEIRPWYKMDQQVGGIVMFTEVITEEIEAKEVLRKLNEELLTSNRELQQFAYVASHDLREPLRKMSNYAELLEQKYLGQLDERAQKYISRIVSGSGRMQNLIHDLLEFSRVGTKKLKAKPVDLNQVMAQVTRDLSLAIRDKQAQIEKGDLPVVSGSPIQLQQLLQNLVANAIKFRGEADPLVKINATQQDNEWLISVADNGIGIKPEYREKVFEVFSRLHSRDQYEGTGIGLAICKKIVERHGGNIWLESEFGRGTRFLFTLPMGDG